MSEKKKQSIILPVFWLVFSSAMLLKYGYAGWAYYPTIDDWIQYGVYQLYEDKYREIFLNFSYHTRPLASLADLYVWGRFWPNLAFPLFMLTAMHTASCYLLYRIFGKLGLPFGALAVVLFGLMPVASEATYWLSASTRLVVGVFLMLVSLAFLIGALEKRGKTGWLYLLGFFLFQLLSFGLYEQIIALGAAAACLLLFWNKRWTWFVLPISNVGIIGTYYVVCKAGGNVEERGQVVAAERFWNHVGGVFNQFYRIMVKVHGEFYSKGFSNGVHVLVETRSYLYGAGIVLVSAVIGRLVYRLARDARLSGKKWAGIAGIGILLTVIPLAPFFLLNETGLALRNVFPSLIGIVLILEALLRLLFRSRVAYGLIAGLLTFVFLVIHVGEVADYKKVSEADRQVAQNIIAAAKSTGKFTRNDQVYLFGSEAQLVPVSVSFLNHIRSATAHDWSLAGAIRSIGGNSQYAMVTPVSVNRGIIIPAENIEKGLLLGLEQDRNVTVLRFEKEPTGDYHLLRPDGTRFGIYYTPHQMFKRW